MLIMYIFVQSFNDDIAAILMMGIGLVGTVLHPLWLRNIYNRFMQRRYKNMDGYRNSR
jgi:gamma-glutamylcysteine synthetase